MKDEEMLKNINSPDYIVCKLHGFNQLNLTENKKHEVKNSIIKSISITEKLEKMIVEFQDGVKYSEHEQEVLIYLNQLCFNMILNKEISYCIPYYTVDLIAENNKEIVVNDKVQIRDECKFIREISSESLFKEILNKPTKMNTDFLKYERIFGILHNHNIVVQFMSLYEFLMELLKEEGKNISQRSVTEYLKNNESKYSSFLKFKKTRKPGKDDKEDCFTYMRNEIAHCEDTNDFELYRNLGKKINQNVIKNLLVVINDVIMEL